MNKFLITVSALLFCTFCVHAQESKNASPQTFTKVIDGHTIIVKQGTLRSSKAATIQKAPTMPDDELGPINQERFAKLTKVEKQDPTQTPPSLAVTSITEQINFLTQELEHLRTTNAETLRIKKLEKLLEKKKLQSAALTTQ